MLFKTRLMCAFVFASVLFFLGCDAPPAPESKSPNVVLIVIDSLRADALSLHGYARATSPRMDAFAEANIHFTDALTVAASTAPSVAAMFNGRYPYYARGTTWSRYSLYGMTRFYEAADEAGLPRNPASLAEILREGGYRTIGLVTNIHLASTANYDQGFDHYAEMFSGAGKPYAPADQLTQAAIEQLEGVGGDPFFLYLHYMDVHYPYLPPEEFAERFEFARVAGKRDADIQETWLKEIELDSPEHANIEDHARGLYDGEIAFCDHWVGELLDWLESHGLDDNTIVIITSDHGEEFLEHGNTIHKAKMHEELVHVPLAIRIPGVSARRVDDVVRTFDVMPTILDYCGISTDAMTLDARSLRPLIEGHAQAAPRIAFASFPARSSREAPSHRQMARVGRYKLILDLDEPTRSELYDLADDPGETKNRFEDLVEVRRALLRDLESVIAPLQQETLDNLARTGDLSGSVSEAERRKYQQRVQEALKKMSPEERNAAVLKALEAREKASTAPATDLEVIEQLESLGYID